MNKKITRKKLLIDVLSIQTTSGNEFDMIAYIHKFCQENVPQAEVSMLLLTCDGIQSCHNRVYYH